MVKGHEYQRSNNGQGNYTNQGQKPQQEFRAGRENQPVRNIHRDNRESRDNRDSRDGKEIRENRENTPRRDYSNSGAQPRYASRIRAEETVEDIKVDISRIEKEIQLEIKEIKSMRLGL